MNLFQKAQQAESSKVSLNLTLVTGFYDLNKMEKRPADKTKENYMKWVDFLFKLDVNMVFYVAQEDYQFVWTKRQEYDLQQKTLVIRRDFNELKFYNLRDELEVYKKEHPIINSMPNKDSPNYIILTWNKMFMVEEISGLNPFKTNYFGWIDFGIYNVTVQNMPQNVVKELTPQTEKIKILELRTVFAKEIENLFEYCKQFRWKTAGGLWFGHTTYLQKFFIQFKKQLFELMALRIFAHEETIMALTYFKNPDLFEPYYGDYHQILININKIIVPHDLIFENIKNCRFNRDHKNGYKIACKLFCDAYHLLSSKRKFDLFDELIINGFYVNRAETNTYANFYIDEVQKDNVMKDLFIRDKARQLNNLHFFDNAAQLLKKVEHFFTEVSIGVIWYITKDNQQLEEQYKSIKNQSLVPTQIFALNYSSIDKTIIAGCNIIDINIDYDLSHVLSVSNNLNTEYVAIIDSTILPSNWFKMCVDACSKIPGLYGSSSPCDIQSFCVSDIVYGCYFLKKDNVKYLCKELTNIVDPNTYLSYIFQKYLYQHSFVMPIPSNIKPNIQLTGLELLESKQCIKNYKQSLEYFLNKIVNKIPFCLIRYGDGEYFISNNKDYKSTYEDNWHYKAGGILSTHLQETYTLTNTNVYYGIHALCDVMQYHNYCMSKIIVKQNITFATLFCNSNFKRFQEFVETTHLNIVLIAAQQPEDNKIGKLTVMDSYIISPQLVEKWDIEHKEHLDNVTKLSKHYQNDIFLISAGPIAKVFIYHMYKANPNNIYCDIGSALDLFTKRTISRACYKKDHPDALHSCHF